MKGETMRIQYFCEKCGSDSVGQDAFCYWDYEEQRWEIATFTGEAFCHECADSTKLIEKTIFTKAEAYEQLWAYIQDITENQEPLDLLERLKP
jgi:hypothetical protein